ncbi:UDP-N-acetylmuramate dehydrogenase [Candidatus Dependentiae bacterium]|nr:UDP-N-acetylmuramate dehydrogenase [Candidatus Dependentiae bacterium]
MEIQKNVSLRDKNWFQTGGCAKHFCQPETQTDFNQALEHAKESSLSVTLLGEGANALINDDGVDGLVIKPTITSISQAQAENLVTVGAGTSIQACIDWCLNHNLTGLEEFSGIPGTIGGALYINVHYFKFFISQFLSLAQVINKHTGETKTVDRSWFQFDYDQSILQKKEWFLLYATFELTKANDIETAYALGRRDEIIRQRNSRYPTSHTCGSFFRNFHTHELASTTERTGSKKLPFAGYYLDKLGIKGELSHGGATVSHQHANMIVTKDNANSSDVIALARKMQELVFDNFGLILQAECQFLGFEAYPLYQQTQPETQIKPGLAKFAPDTPPSIEP